MNRARRSVLYMPGANERALEKAKTLAADALIFDLEDSIAPDMKDVARERLGQAVKAGGYGRREVVIRINALDTPWGTDDLRMAVQANADAVLVPKVESAGDLAAALDIFTQAGGAAQTRLWAMIEKPLAILNARDIALARAATRLDCFVLGTNDILKETRAQAGAGRFAIVPWLSQVVLAARAGGLDVIDGVYNDFKDEAGFRAECVQGQQMGMDGKTLIHPSQIDICNAVFAPSGEDIAWARRVIAEFARPENASKGVITIEGKMVERLHLAMAERSVALAEAISDA